MIIEHPHETAPLQALLAEIENARERLAGLTLKADEFMPKIITARCVELSPELIECIRRSKEMED